MDRRTWARLGAVGLAAAVAGGAAAQTVRTVRPAGGGGPGRWGAATSDLAAALAASQRGDEVWVAAGTYRSPTGGFVIPSGVAVYGGFAGTEQQRSQRPADPAVNPTLLSGGGAARVLSASNTVADTLLDRFTVAGGFIPVNLVTQVPLVAAAGGGLFGVGADLRITDCTFLNNSAGEVGGGPDRRDGAPGGAVYLLRSSARFENCRFTGNRTRAGANGECRETYCPTGVAGEGGAVYAEDGSPVFVNCVFQQNRTADGLAATSYLLGGGIGGTGGRGEAVLLVTSSAQFQSCTFTGNLTGGGGAGGSARGVGSRNGNGGDGGAVAVSGGSCSFTGCRFSGNATGAGGSNRSNTGGAAAGGRGGDGGAVVLFAATASLVNCVFDANQTGGGGGGGLDQFGTYSGGRGGNGGALAVQGGTVSALNCTLVSNTVGAGGSGSPPADAAFCRSNPTSPLCTPGAPGAAGAGAVFTSGVGLALTNSIVWTAGLAGVSGPAAVRSCYVDADPLLAANQSQSPGRLAFGSPCIDAGDTTRLPAGVTTDFAGHARVVLSCAAAQTGVPVAGVTVDIGAVEARFSADVDRSGSVDADDLLAFLAAYFAGSPAADINLRGGLSIQDLFDLLSMYFRGC